MQGAKKGLIANSTDLCATKSRARVGLIAPFAPALCADRRTRSFLSRRFAGALEALTMT
jgi:hypothetical protein